MQVAQVMFIMVMVRNEGMMLLVMMIRLMTRRRRRRRRRRWNLCTDHPLDRIVANLDASHRS